MVTEVVVGIAKHYVECHSAIEFPKVLTDIHTSLKDVYLSPGEVESGGESTPSGGGGNGGGGGNDSL